MTILGNPHVSLTRKWMVLTADQINMNKISLNLCWGLLNHMNIETAEP